MQPGRSGAVRVVRRRDEPAPDGAAAAVARRLPGAARVRRPGQGGRHPAQVPQRPVQRDVAGAVGMAELVEPDTVSLVTWAPTTELRRRSRGFDHAELLARKVGSRARTCRAWSVLARLPGPPQTGRTLLERRDGPQFLARRTVKGASVLLVDDVVTTGATLSNAALALRSVGAAHVVGVAAAHPR